VIYFTRNLMGWFNPQNPLYPLTNLGLLATDLLPLLKNNVAELGMGLSASIKKLRRNTTHNTVGAVHE
jgi:hypothetical protein